MSVNKRRGSVRSGGSSTATASASKKSVRAAEQDRPDVAAARTAWSDKQAKLAPDRLVFIDETGTSTKMARLRGRAPRGERLERFPLFVNRKDSQRAANKILWPSRAEEAGNGVFERFTSSSDSGC